jgi:GNAT superfamily N-acetyltransferase
VNIDDVIAETQCDLFWLPRDVRKVDRAEILYLASRRNEAYVNSVLRFDADDTRTSALAAEVAAAHEGVDSRWMLSRGNRRAGVERALAGQGYRPEQEMFAYATRVDEYRHRATPLIEVRAVATLEDLRTWVRTSSRAFARVVDDDAQRLTALLADCTGPLARVHRVVAWDRERNEPIGAAGLTMFPSLRFGLLWAGGVLPDARGRGAYSAMVAARVEHARSHGIDAVGLYARIESSAPIVARQGFERHGPMTYWVRH